jgi:hypothetical protein
MVVTRARTDLACEGAEAGGLEKIRAGRGGTHLHSNTGPDEAVVVNIAKAPIHLQAS